MRPRDTGRGSYAQAASRDTGRGRGTEQPTSSFNPVRRQLEITREKEALHESLVDTLDTFESNHASMDKRFSLWTTKFGEIIEKGNAYKESLEQLETGLSKKSSVSEKTVSSTYPKDWPIVQECLQQTMSFQVLYLRLVDSRRAAYKANTDFVNNIRGKISSHNEGEKRITDRHDALKAKLWELVEEVKTFRKENKPKLNVIRRLYNRSNNISGKIEVDDQQSSSRS